MAQTHTILGSRSQRGLTQLSLDILFRSLDNRILHPASSPSLVSSIAEADASEAQILSASGFFDVVFGDVLQERGNSRAQTPMTVGTTSSISESGQKTGLWKRWLILGLGTGSSKQGQERESGSEVTAVQGDHGRDVPFPTQEVKKEVSSQMPFWSTKRITRAKAKLRFGNSIQETSYTPSMARRNLPCHPSALPTLPDIGDTIVSCTPNVDYTVVISMYEVYNDRIFDLLCHARNPKDLRRRPLLFKPTEGSPDRKVVAGLRKVVCGTYEEALMVLETGLMERRVAGTGSNSVSSRSHGFFCVEVKKRPRGGMSSAWTGAQLTIVDLAGNCPFFFWTVMTKLFAETQDAGSERARNARTAGATLAEAGKINESLMYLGQCLQMQSDCGDGTKVRIGHPSSSPFG
jgi:hypothetical protein